MEFSRRFTTDEVWTKEILDAHPEYKGKNLFDVLFRNGNVDKFPLSEIDPAYENRESKAFGFYVQKGSVRGVLPVRGRARARLCSVRHVPPGARAALACRERTGDALALPRGL
jgi:hypothetical protein